MTRACETCEWFGRNEGPRQGVYGTSICREGPQEIQKKPSDWCGRYRLKESLAGGKDVRPKGEAGVR